jgi:hypothetical protein
LFYFEQEYKLRPGYEGSGRPYFLNPFTASRRAWNNRMFKIRALTRAYTREGSHDDGSEEELEFQELQLLNDPGQ